MAVTILASEIVTMYGIGLDMAILHVETASALIESYTYGSVIPANVENAAALRTIGWLIQHPAAGIRRESAGPLSVAYDTMNLSALQASGGESLLSRYKMRRAI